MRRSTVTLLSACAATLVCMAIAASSGNSALPFALLGKVLASGSFQMIYLLPNEYFPPSVRATGFGLASSASRFGATLVPEIADDLSLTTSSLISACLVSAAAAAVWRKS